jgi:hypothetical protein
MTKRRALAVGLTLVATYLLATGITMRTGGHHVRPLFDAVGPAAPYQWVNPPPEFAAGNTKPHPDTFSVGVGIQGSPPSGVTSRDGQVILNLSSQAVPAHGSDSRAAIVIAPLDPAKLGALPTGRAADGNVYRITITYSPSNQALNALAIPGNVVLEVPAPATEMLFSGDGKTWETLVSQSVGGTAGIGAPFSRTGYYVGALPGTSTGGSSSKSNNGSVIVVVLITVAVALALGFAPKVFRGVRRRRDTKRPPVRRRKRS